MKLSIPTFAIGLLLAGLAIAQDSEVAAQSGNVQSSAVPIETLIRRVAADTGREFIIDPRIQGIQGITTSDDIDYDTLLGILRINGVVAIEKGGQTLVMPEQNMRVEATRILQQDDPSVSDHEVVTRIIEVPQINRTTRLRSENGQFNEVPFEATMLVPILRPMMSQSAQLGAIPGTNKLVLVDRYDNVRRITAVIEEIIQGLD
jgi:general secretion pathway protein D